MQKLATIFSGFTISLLLATTTTFAQAKQLPKLEVITPGEDSPVYGDKVPVLFNVENFTLTDYQTNSRPVLGQGHIHLWLDDQNPTATSATKIIADEFTFPDITYGEHTLKAELVNNNHTSLTPPQVVTVKFKNEPIASPSPVSGNAFDKNTALVILVIVALVIVAAWWYTKEEDQEMEEEKVETKKPTAKKKTTKKLSTKSRRR